mmetsp:Transcript_2019/g.3052  ORF Transcript_2019/g.3052 Transcript_2019/m.3052 type:complete len:106 (-) Transcript_2019:780-1097(-)|eukprot:CAMPEP_0195527110 /NCGR_PEP_ID=MMETSP0794_2-20130614/28577_1 /TAXON_ID=515487 /ORGANISM="Stephanopyxis turris, Strain CCMP 815" /LENGTH=105 /DNA_ID=CAMNT_0040657949 /DNA_START=45 /DNA_END=362 /DNA_ORIENTATION=-
MVQYIKSLNEFKAVLEESNAQLVVVDFTATWCGPCQRIGPIFEKISEECPDVKFYKVDVDDAEDVASSCKISAMPTFQFYKGGDKIDEFKGADDAQLRDLITKHK